METKIVYREKIKREPTMINRMNRVGIDGFLAKLREARWVGEDDSVSTLMPFRVEYETHAEKGNNYVEWRAILRIQN